MEESPCQLQAFMVPPLSNYSHSPQTSLPKHTQKQTKQPSQKKKIMSMSKSMPLTLFTAFLLLHFHISLCVKIPLLSQNPHEISQLGGGGGGGGNGVLMPPTKRVCSNSVEECLSEEGSSSEMMMMESEITRRVLLMQRKYISYETLRRDMVPCTTPGASYYNCQAGRANPFNRGCEVITYCARNF